MPYWRKLHMDLLNSNKETYMYMLTVKSIGTEAAFVLQKFNQKSIEDTYWREILKPEQARLLKLFDYSMADFHVTIEGLWSNDGSWEILQERPVPVTPTSVKVKAKPKKKDDKEGELPYIYKMDDDDDLTKSSDENSNDSDSEDSDDG
ncbi:hypothetical protein ScPMuIL_010313 [Solemya velum]